MMQRRTFVHALTVVGVGALLPLRAVRRLPVTPSVGLVGVIVATLEDGQEIQQTLPLRLERVDAGTVRVTAPGGPVALPLQQDDCEHTVTVGRGEIRGLLSGTPVPLRFRAQPVTVLPGDMLSVAWPEVTLTW